MKILRLLSKLFIILLILIYFSSKALFSDEPIDIWNIEKKEISTKEILIKDKKNNNEELKLGVKIEQQNEQIIVNNELVTKKIKLAGLYDPAENGLSIDMWSNSDGTEIKSLLQKLIPKNLSKFSEKILDIALLTNSYVPSNNISSDEFLELKIKYLIKKKRYKLD